MNKLMYNIMFRPPQINSNMVEKIVNDKSVYIGSVVDKSMTINFIKYAQSGRCHKKWVVFSHTNATTIFNYSNYAKKLSLALDVGCIFYDYPGYGMSSGKPTEYTCVKSLDMIIKYMIESMQVLKENIILIGQSIGTGIIISYAHRYHWTSPIILISPYTTIINIASIPLLSSLLYPYDKFKSIKTVKKIDCAIKIFHGTKDKLIPISHGISLANAMKNKQLFPVWIEGASHNNMISSICVKDLLEVINFDIN